MPRYKLRTLLIVLAIGPMGLWVLAMMFDSYQSWEYDGDPSGFDALWRGSLAVWALIALCAMLVFSKDRISST
jgi:hypothetical protein